MRTFLILSCLLAAPATAKKPPPILLSQPTISASPVALMIAGFDRDSDARVTLAEFDTGVAASFADGDADKDGRIGLIELSGWAEKWLGNAGALPGQYDFDRAGDDSISQADFADEFARRFLALDKNRDGVLVRSELISLTAPPLQRGRPPGQEGLPPKPPQ